MPYDDAVAVIEGSLRDIIIGTIHCLFRVDILKDLAAQNTETMQRLHSEIARLGIQKYAAGGGDGDGDGRMSKGSIRC